MAWLLKKIHTAGQDIRAGRNCILPGIYFVRLLLCSIWRSRLFSLSIVSFRQPLHRQALVYLLHPFQSLCNFHFFITQAFVRLLLLSISFVISQLPSRLQASSARHLFFVSLAPERNSFPFLEGLERNSNWVSIIHIEKSQLQVRLRPSGCLRMLVARFPNEKSLEQILFPLPVSLPSASCNSRRKRQEKNPNPLKTMKM